MFIRRSFLLTAVICVVLFSLLMKPNWTNGKRPFADSRVGEGLGKIVSGYTSSAHAPRENATFVTLARNSDLEHLLPTIRSFEDRFNQHYHYDWVFLNEEEFTEDFIALTKQLISGEAKYGLIPTEHWSYPSWIDQTKAAEGRKKMEDEGIIYGGSESYRFMCRYESGYFFQHPLMKEYRYYWRVEPDTSLLCNVHYDPFRYLRENNKIYGFTIALLEYAATIPTLWDKTKSFLESFPQYLHAHNLVEFISDDGGENLNLCHFWSNFEIANADFWRGEEYQNYFNYLEKSGGFFYERWGDAPVHSIAAALFLNRTQIHFFEDIGYNHPPYLHIPDNFVDRKLSCHAHPDRNFDWTGYSCLKNYYSAQKLELPLAAKQQ